MQTKQESDNKRTTVEQLQFFVAFINDHPSLLANKNDPTDPERVKNLWSQLAGSLNALNGPTRSGMKWKETLSHWKNQLRSRARKIKVHRSITGGGPPLNMKLKEYEERALEAFGGIAVDGIPGVPTLGSQMEEPYENLPELSQEKCELIDEEPDEFFITDFLDSYDTPILSQPLTEEVKEPDAFPSSTHAPKKKSSLASQDAINKIMQMAKERDERERRFQQESLCIQRAMATALQKIGLIFLQTVA